MEFRPSRDLPEVVCVVIDNGTHVLVEERQEKNELFGHVTFLGGKVEPHDRLGKSDYLQQASSREVDEEADIILDPEQFNIFTGFEAVSKTGFHATFWGTSVTYSGRNHNEAKESGKRKLLWLAHDEVTEKVAGNPVDELIWKAYKDI